jgi:hypothetical protein
MSTEQQQPRRNRTQAIIEEVKSAYVGAGWEVQASPPRAPMHFTAARGGHWHHVKAVDAAKEKSGGADPSDVAKSDFVQNALSNKARPVYAVVSETAGKTKISYKDVNTNGSVRIAVATKKKEE